MTLHQPAVRQVVSTRLPQDQLYDRRLAEVKDISEDYFLTLRNMSAAVVVGHLCDRNITAFR
jgi:hypothetical protein